MVRLFLVALGAVALLLPGAALAAPAERTARSAATVSWVEEWDPAAGRWVRVEEPAGASAEAARAPTLARTSVTTRREGNITITEWVSEQPAAASPRAEPGLASSERYAAAFPWRSLAARGPGVAQYGPFRVLDPERAALVGSTDALSPAQFAAMLRDFPALAVLELIEAPGTTNDLANLALGRAIRAAGLATHVPTDGSVRSGAVELFLAGVRRSIAPGATFAVHSWRDLHGREPADFAPEASEHRLYLDYYQDMGMSAVQARAFYAFTNSVPHAEALWLDGETMRRWLPEAAMAAPALAVADGQARPFCEPGLASGFAFAASAAAAASDAAQPAPAPAPVPQLAYARLALELPGVLDSGAAFP